MEHSYPQKKVSFLLFIVIPLALFSSFASGQETDVDRFSNQADRLLRDQTTDSEPGAAIVVIEKGQPVFKGCYGLASVEHQIPITSATVFNLASVAKQFTAFSILLLEKEGKINLDDDIHIYLPELPPYDKTVTVRHLLNHTSGIWEYWTIMHSYAGNTRYDYYTLNEVMALLKQQEKLLFDPGSQWSYCNTNYVLLAQIVTNVTGHSFVNWTTEHIFDPLGMAFSFFHENSFQMIPGRATPYRKNNQEVLTIAEDNRNNYAGQGYLYTTIDDMILWMDNFRTKHLGGQAVIDKMSQKGRLNNGSESFYGFGVGILNLHGKMVIHHSGQTGGYKAVMLYCPEIEVGITILANEHSFDVEGLGNRLFALYLGIEPEEKEETDTDKESYISIDSSKVNDYVGAFMIDGLTSRLAFCQLRENTFYGILEGRGQDRFYPLSDKKFTTSNRSVTLEFIPDEYQRLTRINLDIRGDSFWATRIDFEPLSQSQLSEAFNGDYYSKQLATAYGVISKGDRLHLRHRRYDDRVFSQIGKDEFAGGYGILRFVRNVDQRVSGFEIFDEYFNYQPVYFKRIGD
jgi:CubicO group peptidase (beta-lactamase class C family)